MMHGDFTLFLKSLTLSVSSWNVWIPCTWCKVVGGKTKSLALFPKDLQPLHLALQRDPNPQIPCYMIFLTLGQVTESLLDKAVIFSLH